MLMDWWKLAVKLKDVLKVLENTGIISVAASEFFFLANE